MIQLLGLREYTNRKTGKLSKTDKFFEKALRFNSIQEVFGSRTLELLESFKPEERYNLYYTAAHCFEDAKRKMKEMSIIPFDIDNIAYTPETYKDTCMQVATAVADVLKVPVEKLGVIFSGHGVQVIVNITPVIGDPTYFDTYKKHYATLCELISIKLREKGISFERVDPTVFDDSRLLRLPHTLNRKPGKPERMAEVVQGSIEPVPWNIVEMSGIGEPGNQVIADTVLKNYPKPDTEAVVTECRFIQHCKGKPAAVTEPEWYAMVSITARLDDGEALTHNLSSGHPQYNHYETEAKIAQALASAGPRTCASINNLWGNCHECPHWQKITSPIQIHGEWYIPSQDFGFRQRKVDNKGNVKSGEPVYGDLVKQFSSEFNYRVMSDNGQIYIYTGTHWEPYEETLVQQWIYNKINGPKPRSHEVVETLKTFKVINVVRRKEFMDTAVGLFNFKNGVYSLDQDKLLPHGPEYGFFSVIPFDYNPQATCERWDAFLLQIMLGRQHLVDALMKYAGYCLSFDSCWAQKCLVLKGVGSNGKSVFMDTLTKVMGDGNVSRLQLASVLKEKTERVHMMNKLVNYSDETSRDVFRDSALFKTLVQGGVMSVKQLYYQEMQIENKTKFIISCNEIPDTVDQTHAFFRRFIIIPFDYVINPEDAGYIPDLKEQMWETELPGICNKVIAAYKELKVTKRLDPPPESIELVNMYRRQGDTVQLFMDDKLTVTRNEEDAVDNHLMYSEYSQYCDTYGYRSLNKVKFFMQFQQKTGIESGIITRNNKTLRVRKGVKLDDTHGY